ncbi:MAG: hypothetical protein WCX88_01995 [Patescibacteria group bacterium]
MSKEVGAVCTTHNVYGWCWNPYIGWISLNCDQEFDLGSGVDYGIDVSSSNVVTGYAWSGWGTTGYWICFGDTCTGTRPESGSESATYSSGINGNVSGWAKFLAWGDGGNEGWIKLDGTASNHKLELSHWFSSGPSPFDYYVVRGYLNGLNMSESSYSWNDKIGWIKWYSVCGDVDGDTYGVALTGWGISDDNICGNDCVDSSADCTSERYSGVDGLAYCQAHPESIHPDLSENCYDLVDNNCNGLIDCDDDDCGGELIFSGMGGFNINDDECGKIIIGWGSVGVTGGCYDIGGIVGAAQYNIYRSFDPYSCECGVGSPSDCSGCTLVKEKFDCATSSCSYEDNSVIPRIGYYYWVAPIVGIDTTGDGIVDSEEEGNPEMVNSSLADQAITICYPGSEWGED